MIPPSYIIRIIIITIIYLVTRMDINVTNIPTYVVTRMDINVTYIPIYIGKLYIRDKSPLIKNFLVEKLNFWIRFPVENIFFLGIYNFY